MASENLSLDQNGRNVLGGVTNDASEFIKNLRVNPTTGRLIVDAHVTSSNTSVGDTIPGGTAGSVLFLGAGSTLAQDNSQFFWDDTNHFLGLGTATPDATLHIAGTLHYVDGNQSNGKVLTSDASGNATWQNAASGGLGDPGSNGIVARTALNTTSARTLTGTSARITITNGTGVAGDPTFDIASNYVGQNTITTVGIVSSGTWSATTIAIAKGGTGATTANTAFNALAPSQTSNSGKFLTTNGTDTSWATVTPGTGTVTSIDGSGGVTGLTLTGGPITSSGTLTLGGTLAVGSGGTNISIYAQGDLLYASGTGTLSKLAKNTSATRYLSNTGSSNNPAWAQVDVSTGITGTVPVANGGTGATTLTVHGVVIGNTTSAVNVTSAGTSGQVLTSNGASADPTFQALPSGGGAWTLISTVTISTTAATATLTTIGNWTSLAGDTDDEYCIEFEVLSDAESNGAIIGLTFNNDTTATHYSYASIARTFDAATVTAQSAQLASQMALAVSDGASHISILESSGTIKIKGSKTIAGTSRRIWTELMCSSGVGITGGVVNSAGEWTNTSNQITSIELKFIQSSGSTANISGKASLYKIVR